MTGSNAREAASWYALDLGDGVAALAPLERLRRDVDEGPRTDGRGRPAVLWTRRDDGGGLHCRVTAFFSPGAAAVARAAGATPCRRPPRAGLELEAGEPSWEALFG
jgi:hypothetical protein